MVGCDVVKETVSCEGSAAASRAWVAQRRSAVAGLARQVKLLETLGLAPGAGLLTGVLAGASCASLDSSAIPAALGLSLQIIVAVIVFWIVTGLLETEAEAWPSQEPRAARQRATFEWLGVTLLLATGFCRMAGLGWLPCLPVIWFPCGVIVHWLSFPLDCAMSPGLANDSCGNRGDSPRGEWSIPLGLSWLTGFGGGVASSLAGWGPSGDELWLPVAALLVGVPLVVSRGLARFQSRRTDGAQVWKRCLRLTGAGLIGILVVHCHSLFVGVPFPAGTYVFSAALSGLITGALAGSQDSPSWELPFAWNTTVGLVVYAGLTVALLHVLPVVSYLD